MAANHANVISVDASGTNITNAAYVQLSASTPIYTAKIVIVNNTSSIIRVAVGAAGSEVDLVAVNASSQMTVDLGLNVVAKGSRVSLIALGATASTGFVAVSLIP